MEMIVFACANRDHVGPWTRPPLSGYLFIDEKASCHRDTDVRRQRARERRDTSGRCRRRHRRGMDLFTGGESTCPLQTIARGMEY